MKYKYLLSALIIIITSLFVFSSTHAQESYSIEVLVINEQYFPINQFRIAEPDVCRGDHYHAPLVYSIDNVQMTEIFPACGFGTVEDVEKKTIPISSQQLDNFSGLAPQATLILTEPTTTPTSKPSFFENNQTLTQTTLLIAAPIIILASAPLWGYIPYAPRLILYFFTWLLHFAKKKKKRFWGIVYDSISKEPLGLCIVRVYQQKSNKLITTQVTDRQGRYTLLLEPDSYRLEAKKPEYQFPSRLVTVQKDGSYENVYLTQIGLTLKKDKFDLPDIPLDPIDQQQNWQVSSSVKKLWLAFQKAGTFLALPLLMIGAFLSLLMLIALPGNALNWIIFIFYLLILTLQIVLKTSHQRPWGVVYDTKTNTPLPLTTVQLIDSQYGKIIKSRLSDYQGRYNFLAEPGHYSLKASKPDYQHLEKEGSLTKIVIKKSHQQINQNILMKKKG